jgi:hypothetical protein
MVVDARAMRGGDVGAVVGGSGIDDDDLVNQAGEAVQTAGEESRLIPHDHRGGYQLAHIPLHSPDGNGK